MCNWRARESWNKGEKGKTMRLMDGTEYEAGFCLHPPGASCSLLTGVWRANRWYLRVCRAPTSPLGVYKAAVVLVAASLRVLTEYFRFFVLDDHVRSNQPRDPRPLLLRCTVPNTRNSCTASLPRPRYNAILPCPSPFTASVQIKSILQLMLRCLPLEKWPRN